MWLDIPGEEYQINASEREVPVKRWKVWSKYQAKPAVLDQYKI